MINPAPLPSGFYILRGVDNNPAIGFRVHDVQDSSSLSIFVEPLMVNDHLIAYDSEGGWQETNFSVEDAYPLLDDVLRQLYNDYYDEQSIEHEWYVEDVYDMPLLPFGEFRAVLDPTAELTENYPVIEDPVPVVSGYYVMNSEERLNLDGLCVFVEVNVAIASTVNVTVSSMKKGSLYVVYRQGAFDAITLDDSSVEEFIADSFPSYVQQSLQGSGYTLGNFEISYIGVSNLPSAEFFTKIQAA